MARYNFLTDPDDDLTCLVCLNVAEEPWQHEECGRLLCKKCLDEYGRDQTCPNCRKAMPQYFKDSRSRRAIQALPVKCGNYSRNCEWVGMVATLEDHMATCSQTLVPCPNKCNEGTEEILIARNDLAEHLEKHCPNRDYECEYCGEKGTYALITQIHDKTCELKVLPCSKCFEPMQRRKIDKHDQFQCKETVVACKYESLGCKMKLKKDEMARHEVDSNQLHLQMATDVVTSLKKKLGKAITFKVTGYQDKKENDVKFVSPSFYTSSEGYHMNVNVYVNGKNHGKGTHLAVFACLLEGDHDRKLSWPFVGDVTVTLLNQLEDGNHFSKTAEVQIEDDAHVGITWGSTKFLPNSELDQDCVMNTQYLKDDTLYFSATVKVANCKPWLECTN